MVSRKSSCYYLLYKLVCSPLFWIIEVSVDKSILFDRIEGFKSSREQYYIVKKYVIDLDHELSIKHFNIFKTDKHDIIIFQTNILRENEDIKIDCREKKLKNKIKNIVSQFV